MADSYNWPKLRKTHSFTLTNGTATYALPGDFSYYHYETFWNQTDSWPLFGPLTSQEYGARVGDDLIAGIYDEFTIRGVTNNELLIYPTPGTQNDSTVVVYQYTSARPVKPRTWAVGQAYLSGAYTFFNGIYYISSTAGTTAGTSPTDDSGVTWTVYSGKYESFLADTDEAVLSERILEQGVMERFGAIKKIDVMPLYESQLSDEYAKMANGKVLYAGGGGFRSFQTAYNGRVNFGSRI